jgi:hypothetical protein
MLSTCFHSVPHSDNRQWVTSNTITGMYMKCVGHNTNSECYASDRSHGIFNSYVPLTYGYFPKRLLAFNKPIGFLSVISFITKMFSFSFTSLLKNLPKIHLGRAIAQAVSRWLPTAAARVPSRVWSSGICGGQSGAGAGFLRVLRFPLTVFIPPNSLSS